MAQQDRDALWRAIEAAVLEGPGQLDPQVRRTVAVGGQAPKAAQAYVDKVRAYAYRVGDEDVAQLLREGYSEDQLFELTVAAALGAGLHRREAGRRTLAEEP